MLMPSIFGENLFDDFFNDFPFYDDNAGQKIEKKLYGRHGQNLMKTDIKEMEDGYELEMDLPGFKKEEISISLEDGNLTIQAAKGLDEDEKEKKSGRYIRRERYAGSCARSFYAVSYTHLGMDGRRSSKDEECKHRTRNDKYVKRHGCKFTGSGNRCL